MSRVLVIGWDGADWRILDPLLERGVLPNLHHRLDGVSVAAAGEIVRSEASSTTAEGLDEAEAEEVEEHLRGLGYLE